MAEAVGWQQQLVGPGGPAIEGLAEGQQHLGTEAMAGAAPGRCPGPDLQGTAWPIRGPKLLELKGAQTRVRRRWLQPGIEEQHPLHHRQLGRQLGSELLAERSRG